jgi:hypothetical protein
MAVCQMDGPIAEMARRQAYSVELFVSRGISAWRLVPCYTDANNANIDPRED